MKIKKYLLGFLLMTNGIFNFAPEAMAGKADDEIFNNYKSAFIEKLWEIYPEWASSEGYHKYDHVLQVQDSSYRSNILANVAKMQESLKKFNPSDFSTSNRIDYYLIDDYLKSVVWHLNEFKQYEWSPANYNLGDSFSRIINESDAPAEERLKTASQKLDKVEAYYRAARANIKNPTIEHTDLAILQIKGALPVFESDMKNLLEHAKLSAAEKAAIETKIEKAVSEIKSFILWLEDLKKGLKPETARSFRIGRKLYEEKFDHSIQSRFSASEVYRKALEHKEHLHAEMLKLSKQLWPKYFGSEKMPEGLVLIKNVIGKLSENHVKREDFVATIKAQIPELEAFVREKDLIYLDPSRPLVVRETPLYSRGVAGASISSPGPYDPEDNTYYNVTPLDDYTEEQAESYLREYNNYMLPILNIHEAIPGHYAQLVYANKSPSLIKSILGNGAMIEGWAVYTEKMMLEEGFGNYSPEMLLMYYKWNLRSTVNTILDYSIQVLGMTRGEALKLMQDEAFQEKAEAEGKWRRATLSQVQLASYFTGYKEIYELREELKQKLGPKFKLKEFHEKFLSYGSAPVKYIRRLILEEYGLK